jgi:phosphatidylcholine synthase
MNTAEPGARLEPLRVRRRAPVFAWAVHAYTACGVFAAFLGTVAVFEGRYRDAFVWMAVATFIDSSDGVLARLARVKETLPGFDGARLDDIVDYLTFVFLPMLLLFRAGTLPDGWGLPVAAAVLLSSAYGFASLDAKTDDYFFTGFPSYWNVVAVYLYVAGLPRALNALILVGLSALVFVRIGYLYPSRMPVLRGLTLVLGAIWGLMVIAIIATLPQTPRALFFASLFYPIYYVVLSFVLHAGRNRRHRVVLR